VAPTLCVPGLQKALDFMREGNSLVVWRLDRLDRSLKGLIGTVTILKGREIGFRVRQKAIVTISSGDRLSLHIFGALAEFERNLIRENQSWIHTARWSSAKKYAGDYL
jgi:DNA invertase Pin-like site-specific DNA recombinase